MKAAKAIAEYERLRQQPLWGLLAADKAYIWLGLLKTHLLDGERHLPASIFYERLSQDLEELRAKGYDLRQTAQAYVASWLTAGYLERRFPAGASEEEYELSSTAARAIRFISGLVEARSAATESRLSAVISQLSRLAEETETDQSVRLAALEEERDRIDREIDAVKQGRMRSLPPERALERVREIISLSDDLVGDFRQVRDQFEHLNRDLRESIMDNEGSRGKLLEELFAGVDVIAESEAGRTFYAFWRLVTDPRESAALDVALEQVMARDFARLLDARERRFLLRLTRTLLAEGGFVHDTLQQFARGLKQFVQSREFLEQRHLNELVKEAQRNALALKDAVKLADPVDYWLQLTSSRLRSPAQWVLYDPALHVIDPNMPDGGLSEIDLDRVGELVAQSEIDFRSLRNNIKEVLGEWSQASIGQVMELFPASQGLGSLVGYAALGCRHGVRGTGRERVNWRGADEQWRCASIPVIYFMRECIGEFS